MEKIEKILKIKKMEDQEEEEDYLIYQPLVYPPCTTPPAPQLTKRMNFIDFNHIL